VYLLSRCWTRGASRAYTARARLQAYSDFVSAFLDEFEDMVGDVITEITVGMGPAGELRYPAYPEGDRRWRFPGTGEFQCYDRYMLSSLRSAAEEAGHADWFAAVKNTEIAWPLGGECTVFVCKATTDWQRGRLVWMPLATILPVFGIRNNDRNGNRMPLRYRYCSKTTWNPLSTDVYVRFFVSAVKSFPVLP
jgi:hypothetical protein